MHGRIFAPFIIGPFTIIPAGEVALAPVGIPLVLGRKGAFGSGEHETTVACLEELARISDMESATVLDLGTGTGILALASAVLGAAKVVALDNDWRAVVSCMDNVILNGMQERVTPICGELSCLKSRLFHLLLANIYADVHLLLADQMVAMTRPGGHLILSGIPLQDKFDVQQRFIRAGCSLVDMRIGEDYTTFVMQRN